MDTENDNFLNAARAADAAGHAWAASPELRLYYRDDRAAFVESALQAAFGQHLPGQPAPMALARTVELSA